jgi:molybdate transport system ATP-binding protein
VNGPTTKPLITVDGIAVRQRDRWLLQGLSWQINSGELWAVAGSNGAGKTTLAKAIAGLLPVVQGKIHYHLLSGMAPTEGIAFVASDARRELWRQERRLDFSRDFAGNTNDATTVRQLIGRHMKDGLQPFQRHALLADLASRLSLQHLLDKPIMAVSTGEMSRVLIARQLIREPRMLVLDEPFEGLDATGRQELVNMLDRLAGSGLPMLLITHRPEELFPAITHVLAIDDGHLVTAGPVAHHRRQCKALDTIKPSQGQRPAPDPHLFRHSPSASSVPLVEMQSVTVHYGATIVLDRFSWTMKEGENWAITGANGAGKSTILKLITGDCLQVYANRIRLFGKDRGPAQTLGEVREQLGVVSHDLATAYQKRMTALDVVCSGFFDSVGLYRTCTAGQIDTARRCLEQMNIAGLGQTPFNQLSQGQRQMILIARAMVKSPRLLILDEPCAGLDPENRVTVLGLVERIGCRATRLIFVSHHEHEIPRCTTHRLVLSEGRVVFCGPVGDGQKLKAEGSELKAERRWMREEGRGKRGMKSVRARAREAGEREREGHGGFEI